MKIVVDTNILFSTMLSEGSYLRQTLFQQDLEFFAPNFIFLELFRHKEKLLKLSKQSEADIYLFLNYLFSIIRLKPPASSRLASAGKMAHFEVCHGLQVWQPYGLTLVHKSAKFGIV